MQHEGAHDEMETIANKTINGSKRIFLILDSSSKCNNG
jgi:hypothetical protein